MAEFDIAIIGSGFGGSLMAMIAKRLGHSVVLLERGRHPRFAIGESSTPLANLLLEDLARRYDLPRLLPLTRWGSWQRDHPEIGCGLKRGFTFYHHEFGRAFEDDSRRRHQLLVAASPHDEIADTHWYRPDFDHFLIQQARALGVEYFDEVKIESVNFSAGGATLNGERLKQRIPINATFVIDASGPRGLLHQKLKLAEVPFQNLPATQALYTHFTGVQRWGRMFAKSDGGWASRPAIPPPYPVDDAAMHHVFDGGWIWVLRFNNGVTSAGVAMRKSLADDLRLAEGAPAWDRLLERLPSVRLQFDGARPQFPFVHASRLAFQSGTVVGPQWALLPSAAGFVDPLLSTGFPLTLLGIARLAEILERDWNSTRMPERLNDYAEATSTELGIAEQLVAALYASMNDFPVFVALSLLYFAAASFTETARRLNRPQLAGSLFLLADHPGFALQLNECCAAVLRRLTAGTLSPTQRAALIRKIHHAIETIDVAGLGNLKRRNWFPCRVNDVAAAAHKCGATPAEVHAMFRQLQRGFGGDRPDPGFGHPLPRRRRGKG